MLETVAAAKAAENIKCKAFLLRVTAKVKQSRYLRLFSPELGIVECVEKRGFAKLDCEKNYAQFISAKHYFWQEYCYADCELFNYRNKYYLKDFTPIYHFQAVSKNILAYTCSQVFNDLLLDLVTDKEQASKLWPFYLHALYFLQAKAASNESDLQTALLSVLAVFILRCLAESGYKPDIDVIFHNAAPQQAYQFSFAEGRLAKLEATHAENRTNLSATVKGQALPKLQTVPREQTLEDLQAMLAKQAVSGKFSELLHYVLTCTASQLTSLKLSEQLATKLYDFAKRWLVYSLERSYASQATLDRLLLEQASYVDLLAKLKAKRAAQEASSQPAQPE